MSCTLTDFPKLEKDGKVAVLYSPGYGAGWSTWNRQEWCLLLTTHRDIVQAVLDGKNKQAAKIAEKIIHNIIGDSKEYVCTSGATDLVVEWLPKGTLFEITEYDGNESLQIVGDRKYQTA